MRREDQFSMSSFPLADLGGADEQFAQILVTAFRDGTKNRAIAGQELLRHNTEPSREIAPLGKALAGLMAATMALDTIGPTPGTLMARWQCSRDLDALIEPAPITDKILDHSDHMGLQHIFARRRDCLDVWQLRMQKARPWRTAMPRSSRNARI